MSWLAPRVTAGIGGPVGHNQSMPLADFLPGRFGRSGRLPGRIDDLRGPASGVVTLPRHLSWPGMREFDVSDERARRGMYGIVLAQGTGNDVARFLNAELLRRDWPLISASLGPRLRRQCERKFALGPARPLAVAELPGGGRDPAEEMPD